MKYRQRAYSPALGYWYVLQMHALAKGERDYISDVASVQQKLRSRNDEKSPFVIPSVDSIILPQQLPVTLENTF